MRTMASLQKANFWSAIRWKVELIESSLITHVQILLAMERKLVVQWLLNKDVVVTLRQIWTIVEHVVTYARSAHLIVVLGNVSTFSPTPQIVDFVAMYVVIALAPMVFVVMRVDEFHDIRIHNFITNNSKT